MIGTNLSVWFSVLIQETKHEILTFYDPENRTLKISHRLGKRFRCLFRVLFNIECLRVLIFVVIILLRKQSRRYCFGGSSLESRTRFKGSAQHFRMQTIKYSWNFSSRRFALPLSLYYWVLTNLCCDSIRDVAEHKQTWRRTKLRSAGASSL